MLSKFVPLAAVWNWHLHGLNVIINCNSYFPVPDFQVQKYYNFQYETECDGEAIMHLYAQGGAEYAASMLDGVFAFCIMDTAAKKV